MPNSYSHVVCPNCSKEGVFNPKVGFKCSKCFLTLDVVAYLERHFATAFDFSHDKRVTSTIRDRHTKSHFGEFNFADGVLNLSTSNQMAIKPIVELAVKLKLSMEVFVTGDVAHPSKCLVCGGQLSYKSTRTSRPSIGCIGTRHKYSYQSPLYWLAALLNNHYRNCRFTTNSNTTAIWVTKTETLPAPELTIWEKFQKVSKNPEVNDVTLDVPIHIATENNKLAIWIPRTHQAKIGDIAGIINSLNIKKVSAILVNG